MSAASRIIVPYSSQARVDTVTFFAIFSKTHGVRRDGVIHIPRGSKIGLRFNDEVVINFEWIGGSSHAVPEAIDDLCKVTSFSNKIDGALLAIWDGYWLAKG